MQISDAGLELMEQEANKRKNVTLLMQIQILRELRLLLRLHQQQDSSDGGDDGAGSAH